MANRILFAGPISAGKTTLTVSTHIKLLLKSVESRLYEEPYSDTHSYVMGLKPKHRRNKRAFVQRSTLTRLASDIAAEETELILIDLPGKVTSASLPYLLAAADAAVLVGRDQLPYDRKSRHHQASTTEAWEGLLAAREIPIIARIQSWQPGQVAWGNGWTLAPNLDRRLVVESAAVRQIVAAIETLRFTQLDLELDELELRVAEGMSS